MRIAPRARPDDGLFDVVTVGDISRLRSLLAIPRLYRGTHLGLRQVELATARAVRITPVGGEELLVETDGEQVGTAPAEFSLLPAALRFAVRG